MPLNRPLPPLPPRPVRDVPPQTAAGAPLPPTAAQLPDGVSRELIVALASEIAAEMARSGRPANDARPARSDPRQPKPDARSMRFVYGAGAVAAMSVMAVGLVQPDFAATADQSGTSAPTLDPNAIADAAGQVKHVTQYIQLQPGETAPPGATVIAPNAPAPHVVVTHNAPSAQAAPPVAPAPRPVTRQSGRPRP